MKILKRIKRMGMNKSIYYDNYHCYYYLLVTHGFLHFHQLVIVQLQFMNVIIEIK